MNSRNSNAPAITAADLAARLRTLSTNSTVRMVGLEVPLRDLAQHLVDQDARIAALEVDARAAAREQDARG